MLGATVRPQAALSGGADAKRIRDALPTSIRQLRLLHKLANAAGSQLPEPAHGMQTSMATVILSSMLGEWAGLSGWLQLRCFEAIGRLFSYAVINEARAFSWTAAEKEAGTRQCILASLGGR